LAEAAVARAATTEAPVLHWLALALTPGLGPLKARKIAEAFGGAENVLKATLTDLEGTGMQAVSAQSIATGRSLELAHVELARAAQADVLLLCFDDPAYPAQQEQIYDPPLVLYVRGNSQAISQPGIAVVGTRHPTPYGLGMAERPGL
jgi:DNA processing protein